MVEQINLVLELPFDEFTKGFFNGPIRKELNMVKYW